MDNNTQTQMKLTPLMEASIAVIRKVIVGYGFSEEADLYDGIIDAFRSEIPGPIPMMPGQIIDCNLSTREEDPLDKYKAVLMALMQPVLDEDPFCEAELFGSHTPYTGVQELIKRLDQTSVAVDGERRRISELEQRAEEADSHITGLLSEIKRHVDEKATLREVIKKYRAQSDVLDPVAAKFFEMHPIPPEETSGPFPGDEFEPKEVEEPKGPKPVLKKVDGRNKPEPDLGLSDLAKIFNQKGVPGLGEIKKHLPQVARHIFGDGIDSIPIIAKQIKASLSDTAALAKVAHACKEASGTASSEEFMSALSEVSK